MIGDDSIELVAQLTSIGLEEREARLYVHLCTRGPCRASDAAASVRLKRTETYRTLEALMKRGFVKAHLTRPVVYEAVSPDVVFSELLAHHEERRTEMERLRERVAKLANDASERIESSRHGYKILQGRRAILTSVDSMLRQSQVQHSLVSTTFTSVQTAPQNRAFQTMVRRAAEGLPMRLLFRETPGMERALAPLTAHKNVAVRFFEPQHPIRFSIADAREIAIWLVNDPSPGLDAREDIAMWTNAPDFVRAQEMLYEALWRDARPYARTGR